MAPCDNPRFRDRRAAREAACRRKDPAPCASPSCCSRSPSPFPRSPRRSSASRRPRTCRASPTRSTARSRTSFATRRSSSRSPPSCAATSSRCLRATTSRTRPWSGAISCTLAQLDYLEGRNDAALARLDAIKALEEKPADKLMSGFTLRALIGAQKATGTRSGEAYARRGRQAHARVARCDALRGGAERSARVQGRRGDHGRAADHRRAARAPATDRRQVGLAVVGLRALPSSARATGCCTSCRSSRRSSAPPRPTSRPTRSTSRRSGASGTSRFPRAPGYAPVNDRGVGQRRGHEALRRPAAAGRRQARRDRLRPLREAREHRAACPSPASSRAGCRR